MKIFYSFFIILLLNCDSSWSEKVKTNHPLLIISFDGLRNDKLIEYVQRNNASNFERFFNDGVLADYMQPSFPTVTFPNHWTLVTGLYPEQHGIVGNEFYDPEYEFRINLLGKERSLEKQWWNKSEPIWLTAKKQGLKTGSSFWVGSEVLPRNPDLYHRYDKSINSEDRIKDLVNWLSLYKLDFCTLYFNQPDSTGHSYGPDSQQYMNSISEMDKKLGYLLDLLEKEQNLLNKINILIVSDHGMVRIKKPSLFLKDYINMNDIDDYKTVYGAVAHIYPKSGKMPNCNVYFKQQIPYRLHFNNNERIGEIVIIANEGYLITNKNVTYLGAHGYDNNLKSMQTIFMARGPDFKKNVKMNGFINTNIYSLMCKLLNIECNPNSGSIEPFKNILNSAQKIKINLINIILLFLLISITLTLITK